MLYLAANPVDPANPGKRRLRVEEEFREIQQTVSQSRERDNIRLESRWAVQPRDITEALFAVEPFGAGVAQLMMTPLGDDARAPFLLCGGQAAR